MTKKLDFFHRRFFFSLFSIFIGMIALWIQPGIGKENPAGIVRQAMEQIKIFFQDRETAVYHAGAALDKSYIHPLWTPDHRVVTYDSPADHIHHKGLCIGWPDVSGTDFWSEVNSKSGTRGKIVPRKVDTTEATDVDKTIVEQNDWQREDGTVLVHGRHEWTFHPPQGNLQCVDVDIRLTADAPEVTFGSDPGTPREYHGLTLRIGPFTDVRYFNSEGIEGGQNCKGKPAKWCAASGTQSGRPVLAAILVSPQCEAFPTKFYIQDQGMQFISSSPNYGQPKILKQGETWHLQYRVIAAGTPPEGKSWDLGKLWEDYAAGFEVKKSK